MECIYEAGYANGSRKNRKGSKDAVIQSLNYGTQNLWIPRSSRGMTLVQKTEVLLEARQACGRACAKVANEEGFSFKQGQRPDTQNFSLGKGR